MSAHAPRRPERLDALHREMREMADASDWDRVRECLRQRNRLLETLAPVARASCLRAALASDRRVLATAMAEKTAAAERCLALRHNRAAVRHYENNR